MPAHTRPTAQPEPEGGHNQPLTAAQGGMGIEALQNIGRKDKEGGQRHRGRQAGEIMVQQKRRKSPHQCQRDEAEQPEILKGFGQQRGENLEQKGKMGNGIGIDDAGHPRLIEPRHQPRRQMPRGVAVAQPADVVLGQIAPGQQPIIVGYIQYPRPVDQKEQQCPVQRAHQKGGSLPADAPPEGRTQVFLHDILHPFQLLSKTSVPVQNSTDSRKKQGLPKGTTPKDIPFPCPKVKQRGLAMCLRTAPGPHCPGERRQCGKPPPAPRGPGSAPVCGHPRRYPGP